jgi:uncharacterized protein (TIGR00255 family)
MTAFGSAKISTSSGVYNCEIRCVNHRFLDVHFRLPEELRAYEANFKEIVSNTLSRGRVDCFVKREDLSDLPSSSELDHDALKGLVSMAQAVSSADENIAPLRMVDVLRWPGVMKAPEQNTEEVKKDSFELVAKAVESVQTARFTEGEKLQLLILKRINEMREIVSDVQKRVPELQQSYQDRLNEKLVSVRESMDENRIEQEMILFLNKTDVMEELDRLIVHFDEIEATLLSEKAKGRRLDFLMQELNREANTLGSKSQDAKLTKQSVELKVLIEQMREQVLNIE